MAWNASSTDTNSALNLTSNNHGTSPVNLVKPFGRTLQAVNYFLILVNITVIVCDVTVIHILRKCKRIPRQCKQLSISFIISGAIAAACFIIHSVAIFGIGINTDIIHNSRIDTVAVMNSISSASLTALSVERVLALKANLKYAIFLEKVNMYLVIALIWFIHIVIMISMVLIGFQIHCNWKLENCDIWKLNDIARIAMIFVIPFIYGTVLVSCNSIIYRIARRHAKQIDEMNGTIFRCQAVNAVSVSDSQYATTRVIIHIVTAYIVLQTPAFVCMFISSIFVHLRDQMVIRIFRGISYLFVQANSVVNLYLYVMKLQECKMHFYFILAKVLKRYEGRASSMRLEVYNIVTCSSTDRSVA